MERKPESGEAGKVLVITGTSLGAGETTARHLSALGAILMPAAPTNRPINEMPTSQPL